LTNEHKDKKQRRSGAIEAACAAAPLCGTEGLFFVVLDWAKPKKFFKKWQYAGKIFHHTHHRWGGLCRGIECFSAFKKNTKNQVEIGQQWGRHLLVLLHQLR
jgi:hypothetical protein